MPFAKNFPNVFDCVEVLAAPGVPLHQLDAKIPKRIQRASCAQTPLKILHQESAAAQPLLELVFYELLANLDGLAKAQS